MGSAMFGCVLLTHAYSGIDNLQQLHAEMCLAQAHQHFHTSTIPKPGCQSQRVSPQSQSLWIAQYLCPSQCAHASLLANLHCTSMNIRLTKCSHNDSLLGRLDAAMLVCKGGAGPDSAAGTQLGASAEHLATL